jgi:hypothetical protein
VPLKKFTPPIEKIRMNREHTSKTLVIEGRDAKRALTTNFMPSFLEIILRGLSALNALSALRAYSCCISISAIMKTRSNMEAVTTKASSMFQ